MFRYASEPFYFNRYKETGSLKLFADVMKYFIITGLVIYMIVILYLDIFKHFIGSDFHEGLKIVPVILFANLLLGVFFNLSIWYKLKNLTWYGALLTGIGAGITFIVNWIFIPVFGYIASAWAHLICYFVMIVISFWLGNKYLKIDYDVKSILFYTILCVIIVKLASLISFENMAVKLTVNTSILTAFIGMILLKEKLINIKNRYENTNSK
jgi:O-antigen/teichoic acid export membrane protein